MAQSEESREKALFVDDEPLLVQGLQRLLRPLRQDWDMTFVSSGQEALELLRKEPFSVLVTDMRMPGMNGAELLREVMKLRPGTMRIVLSGQAELEATLKSVCNAHQYLSKPCDGDRLKHLLSTKKRLQKLIHNQEIQNFISHITHIPCQHATYDEFVAEIRGENPSLLKLANTISRDIGMAVRILQIANSACFNSETEILCPVQAATMLGVELLKSLFEVSRVFRRCEAIDSDAVSGKSSTALNALNRHSVSVGNLARRIALIERASARDAAICSTAGLLHDIGKIILMQFASKEYSELLFGDASRHPIHADNIQAEQDIFGVTHAEVGSYFLGLWGFPLEIVEAAASHTLQDLNTISDYSISAALQVANALDQVLDPVTFDHLETEKDLQHYKKLLEESLSPKEGG